ncbi:class I adenylate-forming enzyme family protein [Arthrobacter ginsengisoli]|uniref:class I adenylate-forming enzyme family protein n=1 Tax=Arthrobacter ginsengisoli TaxID=1356565 RepID=UPI00286B8D32|nr:class I adenylate-forming enzyme family protein [Arthrobacter ginsengisoli]
MNRNLASDLELRAGSDPDAVCLTFEDGRSWTYAGLNSAGSELAEVLARLAERGRRVAVHLPNSPELVVTLLASWKAGLVPVVMSGLYNQAEVRKCLDQVRPAVVISTAGMAFGSEAREVATAAVAQITAANEGAGRSYPAAVMSSPAVETEDEGIVLFTGGTSGDPKAVSLTHAGTYTSMSNLVRAQKGRQGPLPTAGPEMPPNLLALPLFHGGGFQSMLVAFHLGRSALLIERFSVDRIARLVPEYSVDNLFLLPTMIYDLVRTEPAPDLSSVRRVLVAGQRLDPMLQKDFETKYHVMVLTNYGSTELGHVAGWTGPDLKAGLWRPGAVGRVYDGVTLEIRDGLGNALPAGTPGEIWVKSTRALGYVGADATTAGDLLADGWIRSGDMGYLDENRVLFLVGRSRELIKTGGFQVWPGELEQVVRSVSGVADVAVVGLPDPRLGEIPVAVVVPKEPYAGPEALEAAVIAHCREKLAHFKSIRKVLVVDSLPRSEVGKIRRDVVEATVRDSFGAAVEAS